MDEDRFNYMPEEMKQDLLKELKGISGDYAELAISTSMEFLFVRLLAQGTLSVADIVLMMATTFLSGMSFERFLNGSGDLPEEFKNLDLKP